MGDLGDDYRALRKHRQEAKHQRKDEAIRLFTLHKVNYTVHNNGAHFIVEGPNCYIDFWPGTGRWIPRNTSELNFGIVNLLKLLNTN